MERAHSLQWCFAHIHLRAEGTHGAKTGVLTHWLCAKAHMGHKDGRSKPLAVCKHLVCPAHGSASLFAACPKTKQQQTEPPPPVLAGRDNSQYQPQESLSCTHGWGKQQNAQHDDNDGGAVDSNSPQNHQKMAEQVTQGVGDTRRGDKKSGDSRCRTWHTMEWVTSIGYCSTWYLVRSPTRTYANLKTKVGWRRVGQEKVSKEPAGKNTTGLR